MININMEEPEGLQEAFIRQALSEHTTGSTLMQRFHQLQAKTFSVYGEQGLPKREHGKSLPSQPERSMQYIQYGILHRSLSIERGRVIGRVIQTLPYTEDTMASNLERIPNMDLKSYLVPKNVIPCFLLVMCTHQPMISNQ